VKKECDKAHKALRRLITKSKGYEAVFHDALSDDQKDENALLIRSPHLHLGERQIKFLNPVTCKNYTLGKESSHDIDEEETSSGVTIRNGNLDGSTKALDNDFDRVTLNLNMHSSKKALTILPEEAVSIVLAQAKRLVSKSFPELQDEENPEKYVDFPTAIALPAWGCNHYAIEALMDACDGTAVMYNRSVAALAGGLMPKLVPTKDGSKALQQSKLCGAVMEKFQARQKKIQQAELRKEPVPNASHMPVVIMAGLTEDGVELAAIQIKNPNYSFGRDNYLCPFGEFIVLSTVSYHHTNPVSIVNKSLVELTDIVDEMFPELEDDGGLAGIVTYGTIAKQLQLRDALLKALNGIKDDAVWNTKMNVISTPEEAVAMGTSILAGVSHNRIDSEPLEDGTGSRPAIVIRNVSPCAVGITYNFHGGKKNSWTEPKVIFDYDRRVPAGPYKIEFSAAECVALRKDPSLLNNLEKLVEESEKWLKGKYNAEREEAALDLSIKVVQRFERNGKWRDFGYEATPLTQGSDEELEDKDDESEKEKIAIETSALEITLDAVGFMSMSLSSDG
jgi:hypothetical protein